MIDPDEPKTRNTNTMALSCLLFDTRDGRSQGSHTTLAPVVDAPARGSLANPRENRAFFAVFMNRCFGVVCFGVLLFTRATAFYTCRVGTAFRSRPGS